MSGMSLEWSQRWAYVDSGSGARYLRADMDVSVINFSYRKRSLQYGTSAHIEYEFAGGRGACLSCCNQMIEDCCCLSVWRRRIIRMHFWAVIDNYTNRLQLNSMRILAMNVVHWCWMQTLNRRSISKQRSGHRVLVDIDAQFMISNRNWVRWKNSKNTRLLQERERLHWLCSHMNIYFWWFWI